MVLVELVGVAPGIYSSWPLADSLGQVDEGSAGESNNSAGPLVLEVSAPSE